MHAVCCGTCLLTRLQATRPRREVRKMRLALVIIKGTQSEAEAAAAERGLTLNYFDKAPSNGTTVAETTADVATLAKWLASEPYCAPYPVGTLLYYNAGTDF